VTFVFGVACDVGLSKWPPRGPGCPGLLIAPIDVYPDGTCAGRDDNRGMSDQAWVLLNDDYRHCVIDAVFSTLPTKSALNGPTDGASSK
jgi:hypothetical protein